MKRFSERNPVAIGAAGLFGVLVALGLAMNATALLDLRGTAHSALFSEAGGLREGDPVKVGGFPVGRVTGVSLDGPAVRTEFRITDPHVVLGDRTSASVSVATILGEKFLKLTPSGGGRLDPDQPIPLSRTTAPYDLTDATATLTSTARDIDLPRLSEALDTVSATAAGKAPQLKAAVDGVGRLSATVASRDEELRTLLGHAKGVSGVLAARSEQLRLLVGDANLVLAELDSRKRVIAELLANTSALATQLNGLVADNREQIGPALDRLNSVIGVLRRNEDNIAKILQGAGTYATGLGESVAGGPWFYGYVQNLIPGNLIPLADYLPSLPVLDQQGTGRGSR